MAVNSSFSYKLLKFSFVSQCGCQMQVEEEEPGAQLLCGASQTTVWDSTEFLSQLCQAPGLGSAWDSHSEWRMPGPAAGEGEKGSQLC